MNPVLHGAVAGFIVHEAPVRQDDAVADLIHGAIAVGESAEAAQHTFALRAWSRCQSTACHAGSMQSVFTVSHQSQQTLLS